MCEALPSLLFRFYSQLINLFVRFLVTIKMIYVKERWVALVPFYVLAKLRTFLSMESLYTVNCTFYYYKSFSESLFDA